MTRRPLFPFLQQQTVASLSYELIRSSYLNWAPAELILPSKGLKFPATALARRNDCCCCRSERYDIAAVYARDQTASVYGELNLRARPLVSKHLVPTLRCCCNPIAHPHHGTHWWWRIESLGRTILANDISSLKGRHFVAVTFTTVYTTTILDIHDDVRAYDRKVNVQIVCNKYEANFLFP